MSRSDGRRVLKMTKEVGFYNAQDGLKGRDGGPYLDADNRRVAELRRAAAEGREPEDLYGKLPADVGTTLVIAAQVQDNSVHSNPSMAVRTGFETVLTDQALAAGEYSEDQKDVSFADPISVLPVDDSATVSESELIADEEKDRVENGEPSVSNGGTPDNADEATPFESSGAGDPNDSSETQPTNPYLGVPGANGNSSS